MFHQDSKHVSSFLSYFFDVFEIPDKTFYLVFERVPQTDNKYRENKGIKLRKSMLIKIRFSNHHHTSDFSG